MAITPLFNVYLNATNPATPLLLSPSTNAQAGALQVVDGDKVTLRLYFVTATGASPTYDVPAEAGSVVFAAKKNPSDVDLVYLLNTWTWYGTYIEGTLDLATPEDFWTASEPTKSVFCNVEVRTAANAQRITWSFFAQVVRQSYGGGETPPDPPEPYLDIPAALQIFVAYDRAQSLTSPNKVQAQDNLGGTTVGKAVFTAVNAAAARTAIGAGTSSFDPASPGPIGGTTPGEGTFTTGVFNSVQTAALKADAATGAVDFALADGTVVGAFDATSLQMTLPIISIDSFQAPVFKATDTAGATLQNSAGATVATFGAATPVGGIYFVPGGVVGYEASVATFIIEADIGRGTFKQLLATGTQSLILGTVGSAVGNIAFFNATSGSITLTPPTGALGTVTVTLPGATGTLATLAGSETLTNKTLPAPAVTGLSVDGYSLTLGEVFLTGGNFDTGGIFSTAGNFSTGGDFEMAGAFAFIGTLTANTAITFPTSGTLATNTAATTSASGLVELATPAEARASTSSAVVVTPEGLRANRLGSAYRMSFSAAAWTSGVSGAGASVASREWGQEIVGPTTATGYALEYLTPSNQAPLSRGQAAGVMDWSKRVEFAGQVVFGSVTPDANTVTRVTWGKVAADTAGDLARRAIGFRRAANGVLQCHTHNGTTATTGTDGSFTPVASQAFDYLIASDGAGTITLTVNDTVVATCTGGPTSAGVAAASIIQAEVQNTNTTAAQTTIGHSLAATFIART